MPWNYYNEWQQQQQQQQQQHQQTQRIKKKLFQRVWESKKNEIKKNIFCLFFLRAKMKKRWKLQKEKLCPFVAHKFKYILEKRKINIYI